MRYDGNNCDGCHKPLQQDEDIVVCPECATPQHRECYDKNGECVNAHLHGTDFVWQGKVKGDKNDASTLVNHEPEKEKLICPNCGHANYPGSKVCSNCNMKFTMFGVNIVEAAQKEEKESGTNPLYNKNENENESKTDLPNYEPPFKIGEGEGFNNDNNDSSDEASDGTNPWNLGSYSDYEEINTFKGPFPVEDYTAGVRTNTLGAFIRNNAQSYINKFKWNELKNKNSFNFAAFIFSPYWFFYRKLFKPGIIFVTIELIISVLLTPVLEPFAEFYNYLLTIDIEQISEEALNSLVDKMMALTDEILLPMVIAGAVIILMHIVSGFIANKLYKTYCINNISAGLSKSTLEEKIAFFAKKGGTSLLFVLAAYFAKTLLSTIVSYIMM